MDFPPKPESIFSRVLRHTFGWIGVVAPVIGFAGIFLGGASFWVAILVIGAVAPLLGTIVHLATTHALSQQQKTAWRRRMGGFQLNSKRWLIMLEYLLSAKIPTINDE